jgi:hypothetical protein
MTDEQTEIQKVLDKFAQVHCIGHPNKWDDLETGLHISYDGAKILATLTYRAGREYERMNWVKQQQDLYLSRYCGKSKFALQLNEKLASQREMKP